MNYVWICYCCFSSWGRRSVFSCCIDISGLSLLCLIKPVKIFDLLFAFGSHVYWGVRHISAASYLSYSCRISILAVVTPLQAEQFAWEMHLHPSWQLVQFVLEGIRHGFKLVFCRTQPLKPAIKNKPLVDQHASVIDEYPASEPIWLTQPLSEQLRRFPEMGATGEFASHCGSFVTQGL